MSGPGCIGYTSQAAEQVIEATLNIQNKLYLLDLEFIGVMTLSWTRLSQRKGKC